MKYSEIKNEDKVSKYSWDSLIENFGLEMLKEIASHAYGQDYSDYTDNSWLYNELWKAGHIDNFLDLWYFKANYYNLYGDEPDMNDIEVE
jgi:hypothetical protein